MNNTDKEFVEWLESEIDDLRAKSQKHVRTDVSKYNAIINCVWHLQSVRNKFGELKNIGWGDNNE